MGELSASIAHEVNQPLAAIIGNAQAIQAMLAAGGDPGEVAEALREIVRAGGRAAAVIAGVRGFLRQARADQVPVDVDDFVREVVALVRAEMTRRGVAVRLRLAGDLPPVVGDRVLLQQVLLNLMTNGADAMADTGRPRELTVRSAADGDGVTVTVTDTGAGLDPAAAGQAFEPFFTTKPGGMGMGLTICKTIVEAHGGRIGAVSNTGGGTVVWFLLPVPREDTP
jgi:C4-dicarboxylate-specific signal transduction histidine kinase